MLLALRLLYEGTVTPVGNNIVIQGLAQGRYMFQGYSMSFASLPTTSPNAGQYRKIPIGFMHF